MACISQKPGFVSKVGLFEEFGISIKKPLLPLLPLFLTPLNPFVRDDALQKELALPAIPLTFHSVFKHGRVLFVVCIL